MTTKTVPITDILTDEQLKNVVTIINANPDDIALARELKAYLNQFKAELEAYGILPDYLAYVLVAHKLNIRNNS